MTALILKRAPIGWNQDDFDVLEDGKIKPNSPHVMIEQDGLSTGRRGSSLFAALRK